MKNITLSIVVPTFNRAHLLNFLLQAIARDLSSWPEDVELIVVDNASTDDTGEVVGAFVKKGIPVKLVKNPVNVGMDRNLAACFGLATGKYFWQIGDDDIPFEGVVNYVLTICRTRYFGILHIGCAGFADGNQANILSSHIPDEVGVLTLNSKAMFRSVNVFLTFISANIVNRKAVLDCIPGFDHESEINTWLPQMAWMFGALRVCDIHLHISQPLFGALSGNTGGYRLVEVFGNNLAKITERHMADTLPNARRIMSNAALTRVIVTEIWAARRSGVRTNKFADENLKEALRCLYGDRPYFQLVISPILFSENLLFARVLFHLLHQFNRINQKLDYALL